MPKGTLASVMRQPGSRDEGNEKLKYLVRINKDSDSDWGGLVPDLPGLCF